jgi:hypothetical protein
VNAKDPIDWSDRQNVLLLLTGVKCCTTQVVAIARRTL